MFKNTFEKTHSFIKIQLQMEIETTKIQIC